jgi:hypothetical protein
MSPTLLITPGLRRNLKHNLTEILVCVESMAMEELEISRSTLEMLLWVCFVGGVTFGETEWFASQIPKLMACLGLWKMGTDEMELFLARFLW